MSKLSRLVSHSLQPYSVFLRSLFLPALFLIPLFLLAACSGSGSSGSTSSYLNLKKIPADTKVVVVEFSDFNCPACKAAYPVARQVRQMAGVHFEYRNFPLEIPGHETSLAAASAYECGAEQGLAKEFENALFDNQGKFSAQFLAELPSKYGFQLDQTVYATCLRTKKYVPKVLEDVKTATRTGLNSTPSFIVNGKVIRGARRLIEAVETELAK